VGAALTGPAGVDGAAQQGRVSIKPTGGIPQEPSHFLRWGDRTHQGADPTQVVFAMPEPVGMTLFQNQVVLLCQLDVGARMGTALPRAFLHHLS
jgi:hypothetical protein